MLKHFCSSLVLVSVHLVLLYSLYQNSSKLISSDGRNTMWASSFLPSSLPHLVIFLPFNLIFLAIPKSKIASPHSLVFKYRQNCYDKLWKCSIISLLNLLKWIPLFHISIKTEFYSHLFSQLHNCPCSLVCPHWHKTWMSAKHWIRLWGIPGEADELQRIKRGKEEMFGTVTTVVIPKLNGCWSNVAVK